MIPTQSQIDAAKLVVEMLTEDGQEIPDEIRLVAECESPVKDWSDRPLIHVGVTTRHPEDYELINHATGEHWQLVATKGAPNNRNPHPGEWKRKT